MVSTVAACLHRESLCRSSSFSAHRYTLGSFGGAKLTLCVILNVCLSLNADPAINTSCLGSWERLQQEVLIVDGQMDPLPAEDSAFFLFYWLRTFCRCWYSSLHAVCVHRVQLGRSSVCCSRANDFSAQVNTVAIRARELSFLQELELNPVDGSAAFFIHACSVSKWFNLTSCWVDVQPPRDADVDLVFFSDFGQSPPFGFQFIE